MSSASSVDPGGLLRAAAERFSKAWDEYWSARDLPWDVFVESFTALGERGSELLDFSLRALEDDEVEVQDYMTIQTLMLLMQLADDLVLLDDAASSEASYETLLLSPRSPWETLLYRSGVADWCARLGAPIDGEDGATIGFGIGPPPGVMDERSVNWFQMEFGAPGAELAAPDARRDLDKVIARALPSYWAMLEKIADDAPFSHDYRHELATIGVEILRTVKITGPPVLGELALDGTTGNESQPVFIEKLMMLLLVGRYLKVIAGRRTPEERAALEMLDADDLAIFEWGTES